MSGRPDQPAGRSRIDASGSRVATDPGTAGRGARYQSRLYDNLKRSENMAALEEGYGRKEGYDVIAADKVEGTAVYNMAGEKLGTIKNVMIDKLSGKVVYATLGSGGVLGIGQKYYPLPWNVLTYNTDLGGYQLDVDREKLEAGPAATEEELTQKFQDKDWGRKVYDYYGSSGTS
jgi:sporulation protein YlmC with PRC-barrel domain